MPDLTKQSELKNCTETPMSDHIDRFWRLLETEHVRISVDLKREIGHDSPDGPTVYWDCSTFSDDVAKALVRERNTRPASAGVREALEEARDYFIPRAKFINGNPDRKNEEHKLLDLIEDRLSDHGVQKSAGVEGAPDADRSERKYSRGVTDADLLVGALWSDLFDNDLVKSEGADFFDKWRERIRSLPNKSDGGVEGHAATMAATQPERPAGDNDPEASADRCVGRTAGIKPGPSDAKLAIAVSALEFVRDGYGDQDVNHVDYRVRVYEVALDALAQLTKTPSADHDAGNLRGFADPNEHQRQALSRAYGVIDPDYARIFTIARCLAWAEGYALAMHGSFTRDLDLIAVPWAARACDPEHLAKRIESAAGLKITVPPKNDKPHNRLVWTMTFPEFGDPRFVDLSIIPPQHEVELSEEDVRMIDQAWETHKAALPLTAQALAEEIHIQMSVNKTCVVSGANALAKALLEKFKITQLTKTPSADHDAGNLRDKLDIAISALEFARDGYERIDIKHIDYRVGVYTTACDALDTIALPSAPNHQPHAVSQGTSPELLALIERAKSHVMTPEEQYEQRRSFVRGMCPFNRDYASWCAEVDRLLPPLASPAKTGGAS